MHLKSLSIYKNIVQNLIVRYYADECVEKDKVDCKPEKLWCRLPVSVVINSFKSTTFLYLLIMLEFCSNCELF